MAILLNADGTTSQAFAISGSILKDDAVEGLQVTSDGTTLATLQGADPSSNEDFATKNYVDLNASSASSTKAASIPHGHAEGTGTKTSTATIPQATVTLRVIVEVSVAYDSGTTLSAGYADNATAFLSALDVTTTDTFIFDVLAEQTNVAAQELMLTVANASPLSSGALKVYFQYVETLVA